MTDELEKLRGENERLKSENSYMANLSMMPESDWHRGVKAELSSLREENATLKAHLEQRSRGDDPAMRLERELREKAESELAALRLACGVKDEALKYIKNYDFYGRLANTLDTKHHVNEMAEQALSTQPNQTLEAVRKLAEAADEVRKTWWSSRSRDEFKELNSALTNCRRELGL